MTWLPAPGDESATTERLEIEKASQLARAAERLPFVRLVECRRGASPQTETIVIDVEVERPQYPVLDVRASERIAVTFSPDNQALPEVLVLREDFPLVPHLNSRTVEYPRSLCIYEDAFAELSLKWSPVRFIEDIRSWLSQTARNELHQAGQPLEPLLEPAALDLIFPPSILRDVEPGAYLFLQHAIPENNQRSLFVHRSVGSAADATMFAVYLKGKTQTHGVIRRKPATLADLREFLEPVGIDVVGSIQTALRDYLANGGGRTPLVLFALFVDLPKSRQASQPAETTDRLAFVVQERIEPLSVALGVSQRVDNNVGYLLRGAEATVRPEQLAVIPMRRLAMLTPETAAELNGVKPVADPMVFIGLGALGSQLFLNLWRSGFGRWTLMDRDLQFPHNVARHALASSLGEFKAAAMAQVASTIFPEHKPAYIVADVLIPGQAQTEVQSAIEKGVAVIDASASVAVGRQLARGYDGGRRMSVFLNPLGTDLVLLTEPADRSIRVDQLEMMYYRAIVEDKRLEGHLSRSERPLRYSNACRDLSAIISQDDIAMHAGIGSRAIRDGLATPGAAISVWRADKRGTVTRIDVAVATPIVYPSREWTVLIDSEVQQMLFKYRLERLPNETGGILLDSFDMTRRLVLVSSALSSPEDSKEWPTVYVRGSAGLQAAVARAETATAGGLEYAGEWHSHPRQHTSEASEDDARALLQLSQVMLEDARPAIMLIVSDTDIAAYVRVGDPSPNSQRAA